jgi:hypothetical protein
MESFENPDFSLPLDLPSDLGRPLEALPVRKSAFIIVNILASFVFLLGFSMLGSNVWQIISAEGDIQRIQALRGEVGEVKYTWRRIAKEILGGGALLYFGVSTYRGSRRLQRVGGGLYICEHGLFWRRAYEVRVMRWDEIDRIEVLGSPRKLPPDDMEPDLISPEKPPGYLIYGTDGGGFEIGRTDGLHLGQLYQVLKRRAAEHGIRLETQC